MQNLKNLAWTVSMEMPIIKCVFCQIRKHLNYLTWIHGKKREKRYIHDLLDLLNNSTEFILNWIRIKFFQLKLFDTAVTRLGHWKCTEQVRFNVKYHHAKFDTDYIYGIWENPNVKLVFNMPGHLTIQKDVIYLSWTHIRVAQFILRHLLLKVWSNIQNLN